MLGFIRKTIANSQFDPGLAGILFNPFYLVREGLARDLKPLAQSLKGKLIDLGCGNKPYKPMFTNVDSYTGLEIVDFHSVKFPPEVKYDGFLVPLKDSCADCVFTSQVLEHVFEPAQFLQEIHRVLKPEGKLLLTVPFVWDEHSQPWDYARYSSFGLKYLLEKHGFKIVVHKKTCTDVRVLFQLINAYIFKITRTQNAIVNLLFSIFLMSPFTVLGLIFSKILPSNEDLYMDNVILVQKA